MLKVPAAEAVPAMRLEVDELARQVTALREQADRQRQRLDKLILLVDAMRYKVEARPPSYWSLERARIQGNR